MQDLFYSYEKSFEININCATFPIPMEYLNVDETLCAYQRMEKLKQYNPNEPVKYGLLR